MDDDDTSKSSKTECVKALDSLDLRNWLSHHNKNISKRYERHEHSEKRRRQLLHGLHSEANPEKTLESIMELSFPRVIKKNGKVANMSLSSTACNKAVEKMLHDTSMHERYNAGLHPVTLLAEQRRKIVLNALTDFGYDNEEKRVSQTKLTELLEGKNLGMVVDDGKGYSAKLTPLTTQQLSSHGSRHHRHPHQSHVHHPTVDSSQGPVEPQKFTPKWDHYDTMRTRWGYIQPQVRSLIQDDQLIAPRKSQKYIKIDKQTLIHGNVNDIHHFESQFEKKAAKQSSTLNKTQKMEAERIEKANTYYIPSPCVRY